MSLSYGRTRGFLTLVLALLTLLTAVPAVAQEVFLNRRDSPWESAEWRGGMTGSAVPSFVPTVPTPGVLPSPLDYHESSMASLLDGEEEPLNGWGAIVGMAIAGAGMGAMTSKLFDNILTLQGDHPVWAATGKGALLGAAIGAAGCIFLRCEWPGLDATDEADEAGGAAHRPDP